MRPDEQNGFFIQVRVQAPEDRIKKITEFISQTLQNEGLEVLAEGPVHPIFVTLERPYAHIHLTMTTGELEL